VSDGGIGIERPKMKKENDSEMTDLAGILVFDRKEGCNW